jgi:hypothetical protein
MIIINKNSTNTVGLILNDVLSASTNYYLFKLTSKQNANDIYLFQAEDISTWNTRNIFQITESATTNTISAVTHLTGDTSDYIYQVYSLPVQLTNPSQIALSATTGIIYNEGILRVIGNEEDININDIYL